MEDYYKILEVPENASAEEIKKSYRKLSLKYHPDKNPGKPEVVDTFQKISGAFEILGDVQKKAEYDARRSSPFGRMGSMGGGGEMPFHNMDDILSHMFFGGMPGMQGMPGFPFGPGANVHIFKNGVPINIQSLQKPTPIIHNLKINMEQVLNGASVPIEIERWLMENGNKIFEKQTIYVNIPKGSDDNEIIILKDVGNVVNDQCKGDVKIFIKVENDTAFRRQGLDLIIEKTITLKEALCGFSFDIKHINGKNYCINNQSGSIIIPEYQKLLPNMGLSREGHATGNMVIHFKIKFPERLSEEQIKGLKELL
jgi:DnaJ-class molecular chaperone